jgi:hypothetical protein
MVIMQIKFTHVALITMDEVTITTMTTWTMSKRIYRNKICKLHGVIDVPQTKNGVFMCFNVHVYSKFSCDANIVPFFSFESY